MNCKEGAYLFKVLGDETRLNIIEMLKEGTMCACHILEAFKITQPTLSYHMKMLVDSQLVFCQKSGVWNNYTLNSEKISSIADFFVKHKLVANNKGKAC